MNIGEEQAPMIVEPLPETVPVEEPAHTPAPPLPEREPEKVPA